MAVGVNFAIQKPLQPAAAAAGAFTYSAAAAAPTALSPAQHLVCAAVAATSAYLAKVALPHASQTTVCKVVAPDADPAAGH
jgi:hypothetical protein